MQLTAELAHTRSRYWDSYTENYVTLNLFLQKDITDHIDIVGHYLFGDIGIGIGFRGDHKYIGYEYTPLLYVNSFLYRERNDEGYVSIGFSDDAYLRLGTRNYNAYINFPLLTYLIEMGGSQPFLSRDFAFEFGFRTGRYSVGYAFRGGDFYYAYWFGQIELDAGWLTKIRFGYNPDPDENSYVVNATFDFGKNSGD